MLSVSGPPTFSNVFAFRSLPPLSLNQLALVVRSIESSENWKPVSAPPVEPP